MTVGNAEQTVIDSYLLEFTGNGQDTAPMEFPLHITSGDINLLAAPYGGKGQETKANRLEILVTGDDTGTSTLVITGACEGGPEEYICSVDLTFGGTVESGDIKWCDDMDLTSYHLAACSILVADGGNSHPTKLGFDAIGYRYIRFYSTAMANMKAIYVYARYF